MFGLLGGLIGGALGFAKAGAIWGIPAGFGATIGQSFAAGVIGAAAGLGLGSVMGGIFEMPKLPEQPKQETHAATITDLEGDWSGVVNRAIKRRTTLLTTPQLTAVEPRTKRATILAG